MSDLPQSVWREIEKQSIYLPAGQGHVGRYIGLGKLRTIIRQSRRTTPQNAMLWALYDDILQRGGEQLGGWTRADLHEFFLIEHFGSEVREAFGRKRLKPLRRSSRLTKTEFSDYIDFIVRKCSEFGIVLELPGERLAG